MTQSGIMLPMTIDSLLIGASKAFPAAGNQYERSGQFGTALIVELSTVCKRLWKSCHNEQNTCPRPNAIVELTTILTLPVVLVRF